MSHQKKSIDTLSTRMLVEMCISGMNRVISKQRHYNKINVFPVADGDTGTNLALTFDGIIEDVQRVQNESLQFTLTTLSNSALMHARGNSGTIFAQFLVGFCEAIIQSEASADTVLSLPGFVKGVDAAYRYAYDALSSPQEGTILTVMKDFHGVCDSHKDSPEYDFSQLIDEGFTVIKESLENTPNQLAVLKEACVVDAGAEAFVDFIDGLHHYLVTGEMIVVENELKKNTEDDHESNQFDRQVEAHHKCDSSSRYRYCTECVIEGESINRETLRSYLNERSDCVIVAGGMSCVKVHCHTNEPNDVFEYCSKIGTVSRSKADDMYQQKKVLKKKQRVAILTDSSADIFPEDIDKFNIHVVPLLLVIDGQSYLDKVSMLPEEFYQKLRDCQGHPSTSQPSTGVVKQKMEYLLTHYDSIVAIHIAKELSGTLDVTLGLSKQHGGRVTVVDGGAAGVELGVIVKEAARVAAHNAGHEEVLATVDRIKKRVISYSVPLSLSCAVRGGRVPKSVQSAFDLFKLKPILRFNDKGEIKPAGITRVKDNIVEKLYEFVLKKLIAGTKYRFVVTHTDAEADAEKLANLLLASPSVLGVRCLICSPVVGAHVGPGGLGVAIVREEDD